MLTASLTTAVADLDLTLEVPRHVVALVGPNGAGKTTLVRALLGGLRPTSGRIVVAGRPVFDAELGLDRPTSERALGYVPQDYGLFPHMTVAAHVRFAHACRGRVDDVEVQRDLAALGMTAMASRRPHQLSGGERQRLALARALAGAPAALLLDEPLAALDITARRDVRAFLAETLRRVQLPTLLITHDPMDVEALADSVLVLEAGRITQRGSVAALKASPATRFVADFLTAAR